MDSSTDCSTTTTTDCMYVLVIESAGTMYGVKLFFLCACARPAMAGLTCYTTICFRLYFSHMIGGRIQSDRKAIQQPQQDWDGDKEQYSLSQASDLRNINISFSQSRRVFYSMFRRYSVNRLSAGRCCEKQNRYKDE